MQEVAEEDSLGDEVPEDEEELIEHDSLQPKTKSVVEKKKLIIPYNESFSSTTSVFTTSQDGSLESNKNQTEEDSLTTVSQSNVTLNMVPLKPWLNNHHRHQASGPMIIGPEYQPSKPTEVVTTATGAQQALQPRPQGSSSLMKLATERMKKKFLGWS